MALGRPCTDTPLPAARERRVHEDHCGQSVTAEMVDQFTVVSRNRRAWEQMGKELPAIRIDLIEVEAAAVHRRPQCKRAIVGRRLEHRVACPKLRRARHQPGQYGPGRELL